MAGMRYPVRYENAIRSEEFEILATGRLMRKESRRPVMRGCLAAIVLLLGSSSFAQDVPDLPFESVPDFFKLPAGTNFGEVSGVAVNSRGHIFVFTRSNSAQGPAFAPSAAQLLEFGPRGEFVREIGRGLYGWS